MTRTGCASLPIMVVVLLLAALLGPAPGDGQGHSPIPLDPTAPDSQRPEREDTPEDTPEVTPEDTPLAPLDRSRSQPLAVSPNLLMRDLLGRQATDRLIILLSLEEDYSDNFDQENEDKRRESRTSLVLGTRYQVKSKGWYLSLTNTLDANYEAEAEELNLGFTNLALDMGYQLPRISLSLRDTFVRDDSLEEASETGNRRERTTFFRNTITPQIDFQLSRFSTFQLAYTNIFLKVEAGDQEDAVTDRIQASLQSQLTRTLRSRLSYQFTRDDDESSDPAYEFTMSADVTYDLFRNLALSIDGSWSYENREPEDTDSLRYGGSLTARYRLTPELSLLIGAGATLFDDEDGDPELVFLGQLGLDGKLQIVPGTRLSLRSSQRVENTQGEIEDSGIVLRRTFNARLEQDISRTLLLELFATMAFTESLEDQRDDDNPDDDRKEFFWSTGASLSYQLTKDFSLALQYQHRQRDSNVADDEFVENRILFRFTAGFTAL